MALFVRTLYATWFFESSWGIEFAIYTPNRTSYWTQSAKKKNELTIATF